MEASESSQKAKTLRRKAGLETTKSSTLKRKQPEAISSTSTVKRMKRVKRVKDPNEPKRPQTAFFLFMQTFRQTYKEANPESKGVAQVAKEGGQRWKELADDSKKEYVEKAALLKIEYQEAMTNYKGQKKADVGSDQE